MRASQPGRGLGRLCPLAFEKRSPRPASGCRRHGDNLELHDARRRLPRSAWHPAVPRQDLEGHVYWVEQSAPPFEAISLRTAPIDVARISEQLLFTAVKPCILTSATLGTGDENLGYFRARVGADQVEAQPSAARSTSRSR